MLADEANMQKQKKREEQLRKWKERENEVNDENLKPPSDGDKSIESFQLFHKASKVRFPKGCVFLAACSSGDQEEVRQHLKMGVNINTTNIDGLTALHQACIDANIDMVQFLVENNADINAQDNEGWTPLHAAVSVGNLDVSKYLIGKGAKLNICNNDSDLPIDLCDSTNLQIKEYLEEEMKRQSIDPDFEKRKEEMIMYEDAVEMNFNDKVHQKTGATPLHVSAAKGYSRVIKLLIQRGANVNALDNDGWTPLHAAAHWEQEEACKILVENGASFDVKNYSGQTPLEVCDNEMIAKLKTLQNNSKLLQNNSITKDKLSDVSFNTNNKLDSSPYRRSLDEINNKNSIMRQSNDNKSTLIEKKQDEILLSPISTPTETNTKPRFDLYNDGDAPDKDTKKTLVNTTPSELNSILDNKSQKESDRHSFDKENLDTNLQSNVTQTSNELQQDDKQLSKNNLINKTKTGLQESLKSLSAQVKMKMDEDEINDKQQSFKQPDNSNSNSSNNLTQTTSLSTSSSSSLTSSASGSLLNNNRINQERRWGSSGQNESSTYKRRIGLNINNNNTSNDTSTKNGSPTSTSSPAIGSESIAPTTPTSPAVDSITSLNKNLNALNNADSNRRYSSAPVASKDEQAELIRKQKAKLERHFRRSTQAVSYEDIKSAEAAIKGNNSQSTNSPNISTNEPPSTPLTPSSADSLSTPTSANGLVTYPSTTTTTSYNFSTTQPYGILLGTPPVQQGVSSLSSKFGESKLKSQNSSSNLLNNNAFSSLPLSPIQQSPQQTVTSPLATSSTTTITTPVSSSTTTNPESNEKDTIIANDIETDKLLNVIEKSKGFSDTYSTTAARRLRNRAYPFSSLNSASINNSSNSPGLNSPTTPVTPNTPLNDDEDAQSLNCNGKKINKLIWNEEKLEVEFRDKQQRELMNGSGVTSPTGQINTLGESSSLPTQLKRQNSGISLENNNNKNLSIDVSNPTSSTTTNNSQPSRQMFRFGQNDGSSTYITNQNGLANSNTSNIIINNHGNGVLNNGYINNSSRTGIKRSVSQVPATDRRPVANQTAITINNTTGNSLSPSSSFSNSNSSTNGGGINSSEYSNSLDSKTDYQTAYEAMKKENEQLNLTIIKLQKDLEEQKKKNESNVIDKREKRAIDRRISELEEEVKKVENLKQDNNRLKEENAALIRVISKLSK